MNHLQACTECPRFVDLRCTIYEDTSWVNRIGGCPGFPYREVPKVRGEYVNGQIVSGSQRPGQQKQRKADRSYNNAKSRRKYGARIN